jgi:hypothetical protein
MSISRAGEVLISALLLMISDNRPDIGPGAWA